MHWAKADKYAHKHTFRCNLQTSRLLRRVEKPKSADSGLRMSIMWLHYSRGQSRCIYDKRRSSSRGRHRGSHWPNAVISTLRGSNSGILHYRRKSLQEAIIGHCLGSWSFELHNLYSANNSDFFPLFFHLKRINNILFETDKAKRVKCAEGQGVGKNWPSPSCFQSKVLAVCPDNQTKTFLISLCWLFSQEVVFWDKVWKSILAVLNGAAQIPSSVNSSKCILIGQGLCDSGEVLHKTPL